MSFFGIGGMEIIVILIVALVVLGPAQTVSMARGAGKMLGEMRRAMGDLSQAVEEEEQASRSEAEREGDPGFRSRSTGDNDR